MAPPKSNTVITPNKGLFLDRVALTIPKGGLKDGQNFRIRSGRLSNLNLGWDKFPNTANHLILSASTRAAFTPDPVVLVDNFIKRTGAQKLMFGSPLDLFEYNVVGEKLLYLTPTYNTGTAGVTNGSPNVTGNSTVWSTNAKAGDYMFFTSNSNRDLGDWYKIQTVTDNTNIVLTENYAGSTVDPEDYIIRKTFTGAITDFWRTEKFMKASPGNADLWFGTNGVEKVVTWDGSATEVTVTTLPFTCKELRVYQNVMIYGNVTVSGEVRPTSIINSDAGVPEDTTGGIAGEFIVHGGADPILAMDTLGDNLVMYGETFGVLAQLVEGDLGFIFRQAISGFGPKASRLLSNFGDFHEFVGAGSLYRFDGVGLRSIGEHVWKELLRKQDPGRTQMAFSHRDDENGDLIWVLPFTDDANTSAQKTPRVAFTEHFLERVFGQRTFEELRPEEFVPFSHREFPFTASGFFERSTSLTWDQLTGIWQDTNFRWNDQFFAAGFPFNIVGKEDGGIYTLGTSQDADGVALNSFVRTGRAAIGDGRQRNLLSRVYPFTTLFAASGSYTLGVTVHMADHAAGQAGTSAQFGFDMTHAGDHFVSPFRRGRYAELEFGTAGPTEPWELEGWDLDIREGGRR